MQAVGNPERPGASVWVPAEAPDREPGVAVPVRRTIVTVLGAVMLAGMCNCRPESADESPKGSGFIAVVGIGKADPLWPVVRASAVRFAELSPRPPVRALAPEEISPNLQLRMLGALRDDGLVGLCIQVLDSEAVAAELTASSATHVQRATDRLRIHRTHCKTAHPPQGFIHQLG